MNFITLKFKLRKLSVFGIVVNLLLLKRIIAQWKYKITCWYARPILAYKGRFRGGAQGHVHLVNFLSTIYFL